MMSKAMLEQWRAERSTLDAAMDYTPDNALYAQIGAELDSQRERNIKLAERAMHDAHRDIRREYEQNFHEGYASAQFNHGKHTQSPSNTQEL